MSYTVKIYLDSEKIPDEPYFTKEIFLATCMDNATKLAVTMGLLTKQTLDLETKTAILKTLDTIMIVSRVFKIAVLVSKSNVCFVNKPIVTANFVALSIHVARKISLVK